MSHVLLEDNLAVCGMLGQLSLSFSTLKMSCALSSGRIITMRQELLTSLVISSARLAGFLHISSSFFINLYNLNLSEVSS